MQEALGTFKSYSWDHVAAGYSAVVSPQFLPFAEEAIRLSADRGLTLDRADVLDVGAGPGTSTTLLAKRARRVSAIDLSFGMIETLRSIVGREGLKNVEAEVMDAARLTFHDGSFDAVFSQFAVVFVDDVGRALREIRRVLRPSGVAVLTTWTSVRPMKEGALALAAVSSDAPQPAVRPLEEEDDCRAALLDAGFAHVEIVSVARSFPFGSVDDFWTWLEEGTPTFSDARARLGDRWPHVRGEAIAYLRDKHGSGPIELPAEARVSFARR